jgi:hypothetical protein
VSECARSLRARPGALTLRRYLMDNMDWLEEELGGYDNDYLIFDCPGARAPFFAWATLTAVFQGRSSSTPTTVSSRRSRRSSRGRASVPAPCICLSHSSWRTSTSSSGARSHPRPVLLLTLVYSGVMSAMSAMVNIEIPFVNIMSKMDLVTARSDEHGGGDPRNGLRGRRDLARYLEPDPLLLAGPRSTRGQTPGAENPRFHALNQALVQLVRAPYVGRARVLKASPQIEDHPLVSFLPLDLSSPDSLETVLSHVDYTMQYGEDEEPKEVRMALCVVVPLADGALASRTTWTRATSGTSSNHCATTAVAPATAKLRLSSFVNRLQPEKYDTPCGLSQTSALGNDTRVFGSMHGIGRHSESCRKRQV